MKKIGLILNNIGTPSAPEPEAVGRYLREFLMDEEILTMPKPIRYALVHFLIVPRRKALSAEKYKKVWGKKESPLLEITRDFANGVQNFLDTNLSDAKYFVKIGMRYGEPSLKQAWSELESLSVDEIILAPLFPQYARATTASAEKAMAAVAKQSTVPWRSHPPFYHHKGFLETSADKLKSVYSTKKWDHVLFSFHGLPESQVKKVTGCLQTPDCCEKAERCELNCYRAQCFATANKIANLAQIATENYTVCFQSRLGPARWIGPASVDTVKKLAEQGYKNVLVQSPSFVADCLETLEEISIELQKEFQKWGGQELHLVPCLNADEKWVENFCRMLL